MSALPETKRRFTPSEYYALEEQADYKSDYYEGEIFDMSGGTSTHSQIIMHVGIAVGIRLRGKPCVAYESNMRMKVEANGLRTYPDVSVYCEKLKYDPEDPALTTAVNPTVVIEVTSPSTLRYDRGLKLLSYQKVPTLRAYVLVSHDRPHVELHFRTAAGEWSTRNFDSLTDLVPLESIGIELPLAEIYDRVEFEGAAPAV